MMNGKFISPACRLLLLLHTDHVSPLNVSNTIVLQQLVKGLEVLVKNLIQSPAKTRELFLQHGLHFTVLIRWRKISAANSVGEIVDLAK